MRTYKVSTVETDDEANSSFRCCVICEFREIILFIYSYSDLLDVVSE